MISMLEKNKKKIAKYLRSLVLDGAPRFTPSKYLPLLLANYGEALNIIEEKEAIIKEAREPFLVAYSYHPTTIEYTIAVPYCWELKDITEELLRIYGGPHAYGWTSLWGHVLSNKYEGICKEDAQVFAYSCIPEEMYKYAHSDMFLDPWVGEV